MPEGTLWLAPSGQPTPGIAIRRSLRGPTRAACFQHRGSFAITQRTCPRSNGGRDRTHNLPVRSRALFPVELRRQIRKVEGTIPMHVNAPPVFKTGVAPTAT